MSERPNTPVTQGERIREARRARRMTQRTLANLVGVTDASVSMWETGDTRDIKHQYITRLARCLGVTEAYLTQGKVSEHANGNVTAKTVAEAAAGYGYTNVTPGPALARAVPVLSWEEAAQWTAPMEDATPREIVHTTSHVGPNAFALRVDGDAMVPEFPPDSTIVIDPDVRPESGHYVVARTRPDGALTFKQLIADGDDLYLRPTNVRYPITPLTDLSLITGVVRQLIREF